VETLRLLCREFRKDLLDLTIHSGTGSSHIGGELSLVEILSALFFHTLRLDPRDPEWPARDRFILSKGHASAAMYVAMAWRGFFPRERLFDAFNRPHAILQEHVNMDTPGAEIPTGSLGMGCRRGRMAWGGRAKHEAAVVGVLPSFRRECTAGQVWAAMSAAHFGLDNLVAVVDDNNRFVTGPRNSVMTLDPFGAKWAAFGWHVLEADGHDLPALIQALATARRPETAPGKPRLVLARTVKGKGVSFMEASDGWHAGHLTASNQAAMAEVTIVRPTRQYGVAREHQAAGTRWSPSGGRTPTWSCWTARRPCPRRRWPSPRRCRNGFSIWGSPSRTP
jgi:transketolase